MVEERIIETNTKKLYYANYTEGCTAALNDANIIALTFVNFNLK